MRYTAAMLACQAGAGAAGTAFLVALGLYIKERLARAAAQRRLLTVKDELDSLKSRPDKHEYRLERYELLWYPTVTVSPQEKTILSAAPGLPHCRHLPAPVLR